MTVANRQLAYNSTMANMGNLFKTGILMVLLSIGLLLMAKLMGFHSQGLTVMFVIVIVMNVASYWFSDKIALAMYNAQEVSPQQAPDLHAIVAELSQRAGIPKPRVYIIPTEALNAFATGRSPKHAAVACTAGLYRTMNREELTGVLAHELGHVLNRDILTQTVVACVAGVITMLASIARWGAIFGGFSRDDDEGGSPLVLLVMAIVAPIAAMLVQMWISRTREYAADATGAALAGTPLGLASALQRLDYAAKALPMPANNATAHMFIVNPLSGKGLATMFSTHPSTEDRIARLRALAR